MERTISNGKWICVTGIKSRLSRSQMQHRSKAGLIQRLLERLGENLDMVNDPTTGELIHYPDADGNLADPVTDEIARAVSTFYPNLQFDPKNIKVTFRNAIELENDPKIKCLLQLIEGLYLARKQ